MAEKCLCEMELKVIGEIHNNREKNQWSGWQNLRSEISILPEYAEGLEGIEDYSYIIVIDAMDNEGRINLKVTPQGKDTSPTIGVFA
ncbi:SAM-dependent methyltransferase [bacterium]|nr:SAM-dependent methyltransferase [bacterium]